jgi:hypothetical protein
MMLVAGGGVRGGVYGCSPSDSVPWVTGSATTRSGSMFALGNPGNYLKRAIDFRSVFGEIIREHLGATQNQLNRIIPGYGVSGEALLSGGTSSIDGTPIMGELNIVLNAFSQQGSAGDASAPVGDLPAGMSEATIASQAFSPGGMLLNVLPVCNWQIGRCSDLPAKNRQHAGRVVTSAFLFLTIASSRADSVTLTPVADSSLLGFDPNHNNGANPAIIVGNNFHSVTNRGLLRFDIAGKLPAGSTITRADLVLEVTGIPADGYSIALYDLHRVLRAWGEGAKLGAGKGNPATTNEVTWNAAFAFMTNWSTPGGDFSSKLSAQESIDTVRQYAFASTIHTQMLADVQFWLGHAEQNFGWLIKEHSEQFASTARRIGSRESANDTPQLQIDFVPPLQLQNPRITNGQFQFSFHAEPSFSYVIETRNGSITNSWSTLTNFSTAEPTNFSASGFHLRHAAVLSSAADGELMLPLANVARDVGVPL